MGGYQIFSDITSIIVLRFVGATLLHALSSGLLGYYWAKGKMKSKPKQFIFIGLLVATLIHFGFNYLILIFQNVDLLLYPSLFLVGSSFFLLKDFQQLRFES
jgi:RsiW-degrading membrane proteinase PrsW (M82 family)